MIWSLFLIVSLVSVFQEPCESASNHSRASALVLDPNGRLVFKPDQAKVHNFMDGLQTLQQRRAMRPFSFRVGILQPFLLEHIFL